LHKHAALLEEVIFFKTADLLNLSVDLIIYDTTTVSFHIDYADEEGDGLRQFGHPKEGGWAPQVIVALAVTREGFPVRSWVFPGNTTDVKTVAKVKADLRGWKLSRCLFFGDAGTNSLENREELARACGTYVLAVRAGSLKEVKEKVLNRRGKYQTVSDNLKVKEVVVGDGVLHRRYFLCYNSSEAKRQRLHRENVISDLEEKLASHQDKSATAKWAIELMASGRYGRYLEINKHGKIYISSKKVKEAARLDGKWVLITNDDTISAQDAAQGYKGMMVIERCFRSLKRTQIKMGPMYHWLPRRIEAHVKICVLALLLQRMVEYKLDEPWFRISRKLRRLQATEYQTETHQFFRRNRVAPEVAAILKKLEISRPKQVMAVVERPS
jgi:transposase